MTLDEAIAREKQLAKEQRSHIGTWDDEYSKKCEEYVKEHEQIADWLEELAMLRLDSCMIHMPERLHLVENGYNKAIDDFVNACKGNIICKTFGLREVDIEHIAEQLKEGEKNE